MSAQLSEAVLPGVTERMTKRTLVTLSHAIEQAALAPPQTGPMVVLALFQRMPYFGREMEVYRQLGRRPATVVVGLVEDYRPPMPPAVEPVLLRDGEALSREWAVVVLTPTSGAFLTAVDLEEVAPWEASIEAGRLFDGRWGFRRDDAAAELRRYRTALADRLPPDVASATDRVLALVRHTAPAVDEARTDASMRLMTQELEGARRRSVRLRRQLEDGSGADRDPVTQLFTEANLRRWTVEHGATAGGVLPLALVLLRVAKLTEVRQRWGVRAADSALRTLLPGLTGSLEPGDRAFRLGYDEFLLVLPGGAQQRAADLAEVARAAADESVTSYPFVDLDVTTAWTVSRDRPVPVDRLRSALDGSRVGPLPAGIAVRRPGRHR